MMEIMAIKKTYQTSNTSPLEGSSNLVFYAQSMITVISGHSPRRRSPPQKGANKAV